MYKTLNKCDVFDVENTATIISEFVISSRSFSKQAGAMVLHCVLSDEYSSVLS